jgi:Bacterial dipeptidyl-peptidase Sh3 domain
MYSNSARRCATLLMTTTPTLVSMHGIVPVRAEPDPQSERLTELLFGEPFTACSEREGLLFGKTDDGIEGFVPSASFGARSGSPTHRVRRTFIHVYHAPDLLSAAGAILPMNSVVQLTGRSAAVRYPSGGVGPVSLMVELSTGGWITDQGIVPIGHSERNWRDLADLFIGATYLHGGRTWLGCDGPGLVQTLMAAYGLRIPRQISLQVQFFERQFAEGSITQTSAAAPPSPIYFGSACGLVFEGSVIAARIETMQVDVTPFDEFINTKESHNEIRPRIFHFSNEGRE